MDTCVCPYDGLWARDGVNPAPADDRPGYYKIVGISLAIGSGVFIGISFVLKKVGLLRANEKYNEVAGEGYGYLRNTYWWIGMTLMIVGEICNFVAYAFTDAILVTPLGALSVVITTILSAIFLKERLSMVGKVACFLCIVGSVVIVMNAPEGSSVKNIQQMQHYVITPGFLTYSGIILVGSAITAFYVGPRYGKKNMLVYISICSWVGGLSVVSTQGLGAAIVSWIGGEPEYKHWFLWVLFVFVIGTLLTEIIFLNKALNIFNAALVTPTYYVYFTSTTIITSAVLFQGFKGTAQSIVTMVLGFLTICAGVVLLQLSKSAKDVPDAAVFSGDLDQVQTIAEQAQPETEPKADAIRGTAAILRRVSQTRRKMEEEELRRLNEEKRAEAMEPITEDGQPQWEWDGLRRRRTTVGSRSQRSYTMTSPGPQNQPHPPIRTPTPRTGHPPLGMSAFPDYDEDEDDDVSQNGSTIFSSIVGTLRGRGRTNNSMPVYSESPDEHEHPPQSSSSDKMRPNMYPVPLTEINVPGQGHLHRDTDGDSYLSPTSPSHSRPHSRTLFSHFGNHRQALSPLNHDTVDTGYHGASRHSPHSSAQSLAPTPPPHGGARRQFSFNRVFKRALGTSEEERVGLVKEESKTSEGRASDDLDRSSGPEDEMQSAAREKPPLTDEDIDPPSQRYDESRHDRGSRHPSRPSSRHPNSDDRKGAPPAFL